MLLALDVGNTNTVFALIDGGEPVAQWRASTSSQWTADEYAVWLSQMLSIDGTFKLTDLTDCIISTVVPQSLFNLRNFARRYCGGEPMIVDEKSVPGIEVRIDRPSEVGADRLVNAVGAHVKYGGPLVVVDSGTATNFDVVGEDGAFLGGIIAPGINLSMQALHTAAARLPRIAIERPPKVIGTTTVGAMQAGVFWGYVDLIEGLLARIREEFGAPMKVVATGGISSLYKDAAKTIDYFDPDLTIRGLTEIARRIRSA
ncbi:type III pantothenate kinase [Parvularcula sp. LCG005]|uniref:type III pantothenate kinase n=1 Tax=Parvularcula sp. LCG005 TaxID=3078805 RepID=UPI002942EC79|nr:type III pantothenate kinase [Parvularcula sp. LCG005]WOI54541.1 type III pantothenate kinase [Parvularcula sp. LCG005]